MPKRAFLRSRARGRASTRLSPLALAAMVCAWGCTDVLLINNTEDARASALDAGSDTGTGGSIGSDNRSSAPGVGAPGLDSSAQVLLSAANALGGRWKSRSSEPPSVQLAFLPLFSAAEGTFIAFCPGGCPLLDFFKDGSHGEGKPDEVTGRYTFYHVAMPAGTALGLLYTDDGQATVALQVEWANRPNGAQLDQFVVVFPPPFGRVDFVPYPN